MVVTLSMRMAIRLRGQVQYFKKLPAMYFFPKCQVAASIRIIPFIKLMRTMDVTSFPQRHTTTAGKRQRTEEGLSAAAFPGGHLGLSHASVHGGDPLIL